jgi:hypothetical protein
MIDEIINSLIKDGLLGKDENGQVFKTTKYYELHELLGDDKLPKTKGTDSTVLTKRKTDSLKLAEKVISDCYPTGDARKKKWNGKPFFTGKTDVADHLYRFSNTYNKDNIYSEELIINTFKRYIGDVLSGKIEYPNLIKYFIIKDKVGSVLNDYCEEGFIAPTKDLSVV